MKFEEVIRSSKNEEDLAMNLRVYYMDEVGVMDWLDDNSRQTIRFNDSFFSKEGGKLHSLNGPAIKRNPDFDGKDQITEKYFIDGELLEFEDWQIESSVIKRRKILENLDTLSQK